MDASLTSENPMDLSLVSDTPRAATVPAPAQDFTPQELAFLRAYSESLARLAAAQQAGLAPAGTLDMRQQADALADAQEIIRKADRLSLAEICTAVGGDKVAFCARLWWICLRDEAHEAVKGLSLLARIYGLWDKDRHVTQNALVFVQNGAPGTPSTPPVDLPFRLPTGAYGLFAAPQSENDRPENTK